MPNRKAVIIFLIIIVYFHFISANEIVIAFTAFSSGYGEFETGTKVTFQGSLTNIGGAYVDSNSTCVCPVRGLYLFTINMFNKFSQRFEAIIVHNGDRKVTAYCANEDSHQATNSIFLECNVGDVVEVYCGDTAWGKLFLTTMIC